MKNEACLQVATRSRLQALNYVHRGKSDLAFAHFLVALTLCPSWKEVLKQQFISTLYGWSESLSSQQRHNDVFTCYEQAMELFPENADILNSLGSHLYRISVIMSTCNIRLWECVLRDHLRARRGCRIKPQVICSIIANMEAVSRGVKAGYLWDIGEISMEPDTLSVLTKNLKSKGLLHPSIHIITIEGELIVANLTSALEFCCPERGCVFVDVSKHLNAPEIIKSGSDKHNKICEMLTAVTNVIIEFCVKEVDDRTMCHSKSDAGCTMCLPVSASNETADKHVMFSDLHTITDTSIALENKSKNYCVIKTEGTWCIPTLLGLFLGYPVVYWYEQISNGESCLSLVPLSVCKLKVELCSAFERMNRQSWHELYSFSIPCNITSSVEQHIELWKKANFVKIESQRKLFRRMLFEKETVIQQNVIL